MFFNNCPCKYKYYDESNQYTNDYNYQPKNKCNFECNQKPSRPISKCPCDCSFDSHQCYPDKSRSECKFCIEGTIKFKNNSNLW